jgi:hypothetical protein
MSDLQNWNAFARSQLTLNAETVEVVRWEPYAATSRGQKWRGWVRFGHTGELGGVAGQSLAAAASLGGVVLVWTGLALAFRRLIGWRLWRVPRGARVRGGSRMLHLGQGRRRDDHDCHEGDFDQHRSQMLAVRVAEALGGESPPVHEAAGGGAAEEPNFQR